jgi:hypothetical protein
MLRRFFSFIFNKLTSCQFCGFRGKFKFEPLSLQRLTMSGFGDTDQFVNWGKKRARAGTQGITYSALCDDFRQWGHREVVVL